jgi:hypothetical protein
MPTTLNIHTSWEKKIFTGRERRKKGRPTININRPHQYSFVTHSQLMNVHFTKKETLGSVAISNKVMGLKKPLNNKLFGEMKLYIQLNAKLKDQASYISSWLRGSWIKYASTIEKSSTNMHTNSNKYVVNQNCRHFDYVRKILVRIRVCFVL